MRHPAFGEFSLLLVPIGVRSIRYEAIINRSNFNEAAKVIN
jgi:hypothetical protein